MMKNYQDIIGKREIKFRHWDMRDWQKENHKMVYESFGEMWFTDEQVLNLQFTGLKDKNGKEIYEGDIVRGIRKEERVEGQEVECVRIEKDGVYPMYKVVDYDDVRWCEEMGTIEIIGNVFESPELLCNS